jgi:tetratricopeptide (TPR) repeat protein
VLSISDSDEATEEQRPLSPMPEPSAVPEDRWSRLERRIAALERQLEPPSAPPRGASAASSPAPSTAPEAGDLPDRIAALEADFAHSRVELGWFFEQLEEANPQPPAGGSEEELRLAIEGLAGERDLANPLEAIWAKKRQQTLLALKERYVREFPSDGYAATWAIELIHSKGNLDESLRLLDELSPLLGKDWVWAERVRARLYAGTSYELSRQSWERVYRATGSEDALYGIASNYFHSGDYASARKELDALTSKNPQARHAMFMRARCDHHLKDYAGAKQGFEAYLALDSTSQTADSARKYLDSIDKVSK